MEHAERERKALEPIDAHIRNIFGWQLENPYSKMLILNCQKKKCYN